MSNTTTNVAANDVLSSLRLNSPTQESRRTNVGQEDFLRLMLEQLRTQDPLNPMKNEEFLGQLAQLSTVSGVQQLGSSMTSMVESMRGNQTLMAAGLVGRYAQVESSTGSLTSEGSLSGAVEITEPGSTVVEIVGTDGSVLKRLELGEQASGFANFSWDGKNEAGVLQQSGTYRVRASVGNVAANTLISARVDSVTLGQSEPTLVLSGIGSISLSRVRQFS
jgi:flagellar basal-body rod modification protein FlgD